MRHRKRGWVCARPGGARCDEDGGDDGGFIDGGRRRTSLFDPLCGNVLGKIGRGVLVDISLIFLKCWDCNKSCVQSFVSDLAVSDVCTARNSVNMLQWCARHVVLHVAHHDMHELLWIPRKVDLQQS